eukprot:TRINITY_DN81752_c0_g1_i1.p1 TRINITY_DN81752_c0_g1~~TRINITY_DN81752_c0_g1_i1.p1  ORF type:complete len:425 (+),score=31.28 TRINITY_DN81752_c0_g1_i1:37-1311(+)
MDSVELSPFSHPRPAPTVESDDDGTFSGEDSDTLHVVGNPNGIGFWPTTILLFKAFVGVGVLLMPRAFHNGGLAIGIGGSFAIATFSLLCMRLLINCLRRTGGVYRSYPALGLALYGKGMQFLVLSFIVLSQLSFCTTYMIFISHNLLQVFNDVVEMRFAPGNERLIIAAQVLIVIPLALIRQVKAFALPSVLAELCIGVSILTVTFACVATIRKPGWDTRSDMRAVAPTWPVFIGVATGAFEGIALILPIHDAMKDPRQFDRALCVVMALTLVLYAGLGALGYVAYGSAVRDVVLLNLPVTPWTISIQCMYCVAVLFTFPLQLFPAAQLLEHGRQWSSLTVSLFRTILVLLMALVAMFGAAHFEYFCSLIGAFCCTPLAFVFPAMFHLRLPAPRWQKVRDLVVAFLGLLIMAKVTFDSIALWN